MLGKRIGRQPTEGEFYVAHFFGPYAAARVVELGGARSRPSSPSCGRRAGRRLAVRAGRRSIVFIRSPRRGSSNEGLVRNVWRRQNMR